MLAATDEVVRDGAVSAHTWAACERELGADSAVLIELVTAIGAWRMIASILHSLDVPLEEGVSSWPPEVSRRVGRSAPRGPRRAVGVGGGDLGECRVPVAPGAPVRA